MDEEKNGGLPVESAKPPAARKKPAKKKAGLLPAVKIKAPKLEPGQDILFTAQRLHGFHGTVLNQTPDGNFLCRVNEEALEGELVSFPADQLEILTNTAVLKQSNHDRLA
jgi:hypothetical protein